MNRRLRRVLAALTLTLTAAGLTTAVTDELTQPADTAWGAPATDSPTDALQPVQDAVAQPLDTAWG